MGHRRDLPGDACRARQLDAPKAKVPRIGRKAARAAASPPLAEYHWLLEFVGSDLPSRKARPQQLLRVLLLRPLPPVATARPSHHPNNEPHKKTDHEQPEEQAER
jgi:hypothetical protein